MSRLKLPAFATIDEHPYQPPPAGLIEPLRALALLYEENGDHVLASLPEEARHVTRVDEGLSSANEAPLLRQQIRSAKALGIHARAWEHEQEMVTIARQNHDDIRMVTVFRSLPRIARMP